MKLSLSILIALSLVTAQAGERPTTKAFKGMELYSWQNSNGNWVFAVVGGTNRLKTEAEIKKKENQIGSMDQLSQVFEKLAEHEQVYWFHRKLKGFAYPDEKMVDSIASLARKANVDLYVPPKSERNE